MTFAETRVALVEAMTLALYDHREGEMANQDFKRQLSLWENSKEAATKIADALSAKLAELGLKIVPAAIPDNIQEIMHSYNEQMERSGFVDTPGGLEHMGDVWSLLAEWCAMLAAAPDVLEGGMSDELRACEMVSLAECPIGLFETADGTLCLKTEYGNSDGRIGAFIAKSGEFFWGSHPQTVENQRRQMVCPIPLAAWNLRAPRVTREQIARVWWESDRYADEKCSFDEIANILPEGPAVLEDLLSRADAILELLRGDHG